MHWAEEGRRVIYITPTPLESLPSTYHDRNPPIAAAFKLIRFMYLSNYENLVEQLAELHTFTSLPSVLLIDNLDHYVEDDSIREQKDFHAARTCAFILDSMNACCRILKTEVHVCATVFASARRSAAYNIYFGNIWHLERCDEDKSILVKKAEGGCETRSKSYKYSKFEDGTIILKEILCKKMND
ncbi:uncharacterized protein LOC107272097 isoform X2 [Cephus cinctus]|nr:uncharacterized protein LOC107272097 isoform X2 [Cephus cinctus]XP_024945189.1 uncharacterized protein LOC107272097 isoform X2 [Cephus cinctus]